MIDSSEVAATVPARSAEQHGAENRRNTLARTARVLFPSLPALAVQ